MERVSHMQIKEIEKLSGMKRANIRFYEKEGFITPKRLDNGYRDYSESDLQILLRIKLLRSLHISLEEIHAIKEGSEDLGDILSKQIEKLEQEKQDISYAKDVCYAMQADAVSFENLDAQKYLDGIDKTSKVSGSSYFSIKDDELAQVYYPWRRYFARRLDLFIYNVLWSAFIALAFNVNLASRSNLGNILDSFIAIIIMLFIEPVWLHMLGTTPGKAIFGLKIESYGGSRLSYGQGLERTFGVIASGMGFNIPIYNIVRLWKSYNLCIREEAQPWDYSTSYSIKDKKSYRAALYIGANIALIAIVFTIASAQQNIPPNKGDLTVSEFVENHNYYSDTFDIHFGDYYLTENGMWRRNYDGSGFAPISNISRSDYNFTIEDGYVKGISFEVELENDVGWLIPSDGQMIVAALAFANAQDEVGVFSRTPDRIIDKINIFQDFHFTEAGLTFTYENSHFSIGK